MCIRDRSLGGARPWLRELLQTLEEWKRVNRIDEVAIFTSASNLDGWVTFLEECIEDYAGTADLFGRCITRERCPLAPTGFGGTRTFKDLSLISENAESVVLLDDKPDFVRNGYVIGVPEYRQDVAIDALERHMKSLLPQFEDDISQVFAVDRCNHPPNQLDFSKDDVLRKAVQVLTGLFPEADEDMSVLAACSSDADWPPSPIVECC
eukprot:TRINITY_DN40_c0_g1_i6.p1 TRINITY_DN40_c0_g1~~TRINITY_DN40_c0_g1_i6.p1  ORF type:complete len:208 (+),score=36.09 TRINITY_DN40_c0_g1_i6:173-796(+)